MMQSIVLHATIHWQDGLGLDSVTEEPAETIVRRRVMGAHVGCERASLLINFFSACRVARVIM